MNCHVNAEHLPKLEEIVNKSQGVCPVDWALQTVETARRETCGKDVMCRDGLHQIWLILSDAVSGRGQGEDVEMLQDLLGVIAAQADCDLARTAAANVLKSMELYPDEWEAHIKRKRCADLVCRAYYTVHIAPDKCTGCGECLKVCAQGAIAGGEGLIHVVNDVAGVDYGACAAVCPADAFVKAGAVKPKTPEAPVPVGSFEAAGGGLRRRRRG